MIPSFFFYIYSTVVLLIFLWMVTWVVSCLGTYIYRNSTSVYFIILDELYLLNRMLKLVSVFLYQKTIFHLLQYNSTTLLMVIISGNNSPHLFCSLWVLISCMRICHLLKISWFFNVYFNFYIFKYVFHLFIVVICF